MCFLWESALLVRVFFAAGTGKGGESIWGEKFEDEFRESLKVSLGFLFFLSCVSLSFVYALLCEIKEIKISGTVVVRGWGGGAGRWRVCVDE